ncbi:hypothetical protein TNCV_887861 [Trichonephila clavipes]|nr:hypothetical protein TNCV_887861 [Trichonephila clavipes]
MFHALEENSLYDDHMKSDIPISEREFYEVLRKFDSDSDFESLRAPYYGYGGSYAADEEPKPRLPDSIARPITIMPLSRMENTTFVKPSIIEFHDMGLRTVLTVRTPKEQRLF